MKSVVFFVCDHGRRNGEGVWHPMDIENFSKKNVVFLVSDRKNQITTFAPPRKILETSLMPPSGKIFLTSMRMTRNSVCLKPQHLLVGTKFDLIFKVNIKVEHFVAIMHHFCRHQHFV